MNNLSKLDKDSGSADCTGGGDGYSDVFRGQAVGYGRFNNAGYGDGHNITSGNGQSERYGYGWGQGSGHGDWYKCGSGKPEPE